MRGLALGLAFALSTAGQVLADPIDLEGRQWESKEVGALYQKWQYLGCFPLHAGGIYRFETVEPTEGCDPKLQLRLSSGKDPGDADRVVAEDNDSAGSNQARIDFTCKQDGLYYVAVSTDVSAGEGDVKIRAEKIGRAGADSGGPTPPAETGKKPEPRTVKRGAKARVASIPGAIRAAAPFLSDSVPVKRGHRYVILASDLSAGCKVVIELRKKGRPTKPPVKGMPPLQTEETVASDDGSGKDAPRIEWTCDAAAKYHLVARPAPGGADGTFQLIVLELPRDEVCVSHVRIRADAQGPQSIASFTLTQGTKYVLRTFGLTDGCDTTLQLRRLPEGKDQPGPDDPVLAEDADGGVEDRASQIDWTCPQTGRYYAWVKTPSAAAAGSFDLELVTAR